MKLSFTGVPTFIPEPASRIAQGYGLKVRADSLSVTDSSGDVKVIEPAEGRDYAEKALTLTQRDAIRSLTPETIAQALSDGFLTLPDARQGRKATTGVDLAAIVASLNPATPEAVSTAPEAKAKAKA